jgi:hypothetical protein
LAASEDSLLHLALSECTSDINVRMHIRTGQHYMWFSTRCLSSGNWYSSCMHTFVLH